MKKSLLGALLFLPGLLFAQDPGIRLSYPREGARMGHLKKSFVLGHVQPSTATVSINGSTVAVYRTGSFAAVIPFSTGSFAIVARMDSDGFSTETVRNIFVSEISTSVPAPLPDPKLLTSARTVTVEVSTAEAILKTGPSVGSDTMAYDLFLPEGVRMRSQGSQNGEIRLKLSESEIFWGDERHFKVLPDSAPLPAAILGNIRSQNRDRSFVMYLDLSDRIPFRAEPSTDLMSLKIRLYSTVANVDRVRLDTSGKESFGDEIRWSQPAGDIAEVLCRVKKKIWAYELRYEGGRLACEIFFVPGTGKFGKPLAGTVMAVDAGHSPQAGDGAVSPQGFTEGDVNFQVSECLKTKLEGMGAQVFMTREKGEAVSLPERVRRSAKAGADLLVSVHANAVPDGSDPLARKGYSVFYFHPMSLSLARAVHGAFPKQTGMEDDGLSYGNLAVCRSPRFPAILVETGYLIRPDEEELLIDRAFQCRAADGIARGIAEFVRTYR